MIEKIFGSYRDIANFQNETLKTYLKTCNINVHCIKTAILCAKRKTLKTKYIIGFKIFRVSRVYEGCYELLPIVSLANTAEQRVRHTSILLRKSQKLTLLLAL